MPTLNPEQVAKLALDAGLSADRAKVAVAVAKGESGYKTDARGDVALQTEKWGPSVGLWQIRSLNAERGKGTARDETRLTDPAFNARSMAEISKNGADFGPWTVYRTGVYVAHLGEAGEAVRKAHTGDTPPIPGGDPHGPEREAPGGVTALLDPRTWVRTAWTVGGGLAVLVGLILIGRELSGGEWLQKAQEWIS